VEFLRWSLDYGVLSFPFAPFIKKHFPTTTSSGTVPNTRLSVEWLKLLVWL